MKINKEYDLICTGEGMSAYLLAAIASQFGLKVLLIDESKLNVDCLEYYCSFNESILLQSIFDNLSISKLIEFEDKKEILQIILERKRFILTNSFSQTEKEIKREYFNTSTEINQFLKKVYSSFDIYPDFFSHSLSVSQSHARQLRKLNKTWGELMRSITSNKHFPVHSYDDAIQTQDIDNICKALLGTFSFSAPKNTSYEQAIRSIPLFLHSSCKIKGGWEYLKSLLKSYIEGFGNDIRSGISIESIVTDKNGKNITGVLLDNYEGIVHSKHLVIGKNHLQLISKLPVKLQDLNTKKQLNKVTPTHWVYWLDVHVNERAIPVGATNLMVKIIDEEEEFTEENFIIIELEHVDKNSAIIRCNVLLEYKNKTLSRDYLKKISGRILRSISDTFPFIKENIIKVSPDIIHDQNLIPYLDIKEIPTSCTRFYVKGGKMAQGYWGIPWQSNMNNLYFIGKECWPSLGRYGETLSAYNVAHAIMIEKYDEISNQLESQNEMRA